MEAMFLDARIQRLTNGEKHLINAMMALVEERGPAMAKKVIAIAAASIQEQP